MPLKGYAQLYPTPYTPDPDPAHLEAACDLRPEVAVAQHEAEQLPVLLGGPLLLVDAGVHAVPPALRTLLAGATRDVLRHRGPPVARESTGACRRGLETLGADPGYYRGPYGAPINPSGTPRRDWPAWPACRDVLGHTSTALNMGDDPDVDPVLHIRNTRMMRRHYPRALTVPEVFSGRAQGCEYSYSKNNMVVT